MFPVAVKQAMSCFVLIETKSRTPSATFKQVLLPCSKQRQEDAPEHPHDRPNQDPAIDRNHCKVEKRHRRPELPACHHKGKSVLLSSKYILLTLLVRHTLWTDL